MNARNYQDGDRHGTNRRWFSWGLKRPTYQRLSLSRARFRWWNWCRQRLGSLAGMRWRALISRCHRLEFRVGSRCITGSVRESNEDRCYADQRLGLFVVADGMGGHVGGEQASQTVVEVIASRLASLLNSDQVSQNLVVQTVRQAVLDANQELIELARTENGLNGMGSTAVVGVICGNRIFLCSVGDSRAYLLRDHRIQQLTMDDTLVQGLVRAGALTSGEAAKHPMRHVLLHSVGTRRLEKQLQVDSHLLRPGDHLLFATDGLTDAVDRNQLVDIVQQNPSPQQAADALANHAQQLGSRDNITCIVVELA